MELKTGKRTDRRGKFVHATVNGMEISSDVPLEELTRCKLIPQKFPGELGRYFLPEDAVLDGNVSLSTLLHTLSEEMKMDNEIVYDTRAVMVPVLSDDVEDTTFVSSEEEDNNDSEDDGDASDDNSCTTSVLEDDDDGNVSDGYDASKCTQKVIPHE